MEGEVELGSLSLDPFAGSVSLLAPSAWALAFAVALDGVLGDPVYRWHPVRLMGDTLSALERALRRLGMDGYAGGILLFLLLAAFWVLALSASILAAAAVAPWLGFLLHVLLVYSLLALRDLLVHAHRVQQAANAGDLPGARHAIAQLVGRDTAQMDYEACRRAAIESLSENVADGFVSPVFWYLLAGVPGIVLFKVVSTMDSMVGYKTPRYLRFGWCGARTDDLMNLLPARLSWLLIAFVAVWTPGSSARKALAVGWKQHALVPGPNSGWSEAAMAGALQRRLIGPIWAGGVMVANVWLGDDGAPPAGTSEDLQRAARITAATGLMSAVLTCIVLALLRSGWPAGAFL
jgi:adenosylcobinamide-phosphate synthase